MSRNPLVSIIVSIYRVERYLPSCIESLVRQSYRNIEILLVNDGSPDGCPGICREWAAKDERITVISQRNRGVSAARNRGIAASRGEWITFVDGDDYLETDAVERMLGSVEDDTDVLITDYCADGESGSRRESFFRCGERDFVSEEDRIELIRNCFLRTPLASRTSATLVGVPWAKLFRAALIREHGIRYDTSLRKMQDALFCSEVFRVSARVCCRALPVYHYRFNTGSVTRKGNPAYEKTADAVLDALLAFIRRCGLEDELMPVYYARRFMFGCEAVKFIYILDRTGMSLGEKITGVRRVMARYDISDAPGEAFHCLGRAYKLAYRLAHLHLYGLLYLLMSVYYKGRKRRRMKGRR